MKRYVITGDIIEVYDYELKKIPRGQPKKDITFNNSLLSSQLLENNSIDLGMQFELHKIINAQNKAQEKRNNIRRLITMNFNTKYDKFITLTFKENITDINHANYEFHKFIKRLNKNYMNESKLKYLAVIEFQERGAIHYHMICNLPFIKLIELQNCWRNGFIYINSINHVDNIGAYVIKYINKDLFDSRLFGKKCYNCSKNLKRPSIIKITDFDFCKKSKIIEDKIKDFKPIFESKYLTEELGECIYKQYNLKRVD